MHYHFYQKIGLGEKRCVSVFGGICPQMNILLYEQATHYSQCERVMIDMVIG